MNSENLSISIIMPCFNRRNFLQEGIDSILRQTYRNFELLIIDDGSTDGTDRIIENYTDHRIKLITLPRNKGISFARNTGLALARGEYVAVMDSDDIAHPKRLETQLKYLDQNRNITIVGSNVLKQTHKNTIMMRYVNDDGKIKSRLMALNGSSLIHPTTMMRMEDLERHSLIYPGKKIDEDHALWFECTKKKLRFAVIEEPLLIYRRHNSNTSSLNTLNSKDLIADKFTLLEHILVHYFSRLTKNEARDIGISFYYGRNNSLRRRETITKKIEAENLSYFGESLDEKKKIALKIISRRAYIT